MRCRNILLLGKDVDSVRNAVVTAISAGIICFSVENCRKIELWTCALYLRMKLIYATKFALKYFIPSFARKFACSDKYSDIIDRTEEKKRNTIRDDKLQVILSLHDVRTESIIIFDY